MHAKLYDLKKMIFPKDSYQSGFLFFTASLIAENIQPVATRLGVDKLRKCIFTNISVYLHLNSKS